MMKSLTSLSGNGACTVKRMVSVAAGVLGLSVLMVLIEYYLTRGGSVTSYSSIPKKYSTGQVELASSNDHNGSSEHCWVREEHTILAQCVPCSKFEKAANIKQCVPSGYYDKINCSVTGVVYRSCHRVHWLEERNFVIFVISSSIIAVVFSFLAYWRQTALDKVMIQKLHRQLASGM